MITSAHPTTHRRASSSVIHGAGLTFDTLVAADSHAAPVVVHAHHDTLLRVISGIVRLAVDGGDRLLGIGDEAIVPAGAAHRVTSAGGEARVVSGLRPAA